MKGESGNPSQQFHGGHGGNAVEMANRSNEKQREERERQKSMKEWAQVIGQTSKKITTSEGEEIEVTNDSTAFDMRNIAGVIYRNGKPFVQGVCQDIRVEPGASVVRAEGMVALCSGVSVWSLLGLLFSFDINEFTGDIEMDIQNAKGKVERYEKKGFSIAALLHNRR